MKPGVSVVVCCHNSEKRLKPTLEHLLRQDVPNSIPWEVLLIDNASADDTSEIARSIWGKDAPAPIRIIKEGKLGVANARQRGCSEARYEFISFIDDDNWADKDYVKNVFRLMSRKKDVGVCIAQGRAEFEDAKPEWFDDHCDAYAIANKGSKRGNITDDGRFLWTAGSTIRKSAWEQLKSAGFRMRLMGRRGSALTAGEDWEAFLAINIAGWKTWYEPGIRFGHYLPASRLDWKHLRKMFFGFGAGAAILNIYLSVLKTEKKLEWKDQIKHCKDLLVMMKPWAGKDYDSTKEGRKWILVTEYTYGIIQTLLESRKEYDSIYGSIEKMRDRLKAQRLGKKRLKGGMPI